MPLYHLDVHGHDVPDYLIDTFQADSDTEATARVEQIMAGWPAYIIAVLADGTGREITRVAGGAR